MNKFKENVKKNLYNWINVVKLVVDKKLGGYRYGFYEKIWVLAEFWFNWWKG